MIETEYFIIGTKEYAECLIEAEELGITVDHYLLEWCEVEGNWISD